MSSENTLGQCLYSKWKFKWVQKTKKQQIFFSLNFLVKFPVMLCFVLYNRCTRSWFVHEWRAEIKRNQKAQRHQDLIGSMVWENFHIFLEIQFSGLCKIEGEEAEVKRATFFQCRKFVLLCRMLPMPPLLLWLWSWEKKKLFIELEKFSSFSPGSAPSHLVSRDVPKKRK